MASLLSLLGIGNSSGLPFTLSDDEQQQLAGQQASPTSGISSLMGVAGPDSTSQQEQPVNAATPTSLLSAVANPKFSAPADTTDQSNAQPQVDQSGSGTESNGSAGASASNTDNTDTSANAQVDTPDSSNNDAATQDTSASTQATQTPGFFSKLVNEARTNPTLGQALMNAGFSMMANMHYGTPGIAAVGMGAQQGLQTYNALKQQQLQNSMAQYAATNKAAMDQADINSKNATTAQTNYGLNSKKALAAYQQQAGQNFNVQGAIAAGVNPADAKDMFAMLHPELKQVDTGDSIAFVNPQTGAQVGTAIPKTQLVTTAAGSSTTAYTGGANGQPIKAQPLQEGGLAPEQVNQNVAKYQAPQAAAVKNSQAQGQLLNQLQSADALSGSGGGVIGAGWRGIQQKLGITDPNSQLRQQFASTNVQGIVGALPSGSRMDQNFLQQMEKTIADPSTATPEQMIRATALVKTKADYDAVDNEARAAYVSANGGMETPLKRPTTISVGGQTMNVPAGATMQQVSDAATKKLVNWDPPLINPKWGDGKSQAQINQALAYAQDPTKLAKLRSMGVLLPSNMRNGG